LAVRFEKTDKARQLLWCFSLSEAATERGPEKAPETLDFFPARSAWTYF
jgi:hypothetical protein